MMRRTLLILLAVLNPSPADFYALHLKLCLAPGLGGSGDRPGADVSTTQRGRFTAALRRAEAAEDFAPLARESFRGRAPISDVSADWAAGFVARNASGGTE